MVVNATASNFTEQFSSIPNRLVSCFITRSKVKYMITGNNQRVSVVESIPNHEKIINLLRKNSSGFTIAEISKLLKVTRNTASVHLAKLEGAKQITIRKVGMAKIYSLKPEMQMKLSYS